MPPQPTITARNVTIFLPLPGLTIFEAVFRKRFQY
jgi:hypothetical protein